MSLENKYFAELARRLRAAGITAGHPEKNRLTVLLNNQPVLSVSAGSDVFLLPAGSNQPEAGELYHKVAQTADEVYAYADEGISGLEARNRDDFNRMMADCREGKIDRVLCKSISRFARNTQEYIQFVRELLRLGISIHFEKENIDTGKMTSEQVAQIYGAFAQMESTNHSSNMRFSVRMRMEKGLFVPSSVPYGYRLAGRDLEIIPEEAEVVRRIFSAYLSGQGKDDIARELNQLGVDRGRNREKWHPSKLRELRKLRRRLLEAAGEDRQIHDTERMMEYLEDGPEWLDEVPAELFGELIERIIIIGPERLKFRLLNGMELAENIERTVR